MLSGSACRSGVSFRDNRYRRNKVSRAGTLALVVKRFSGSHKATFYPDHRFAVFECG